MKALLIIGILLEILSCRTSPTKLSETNSLQLLIPDTTNNRRAVSELSIIEYNSKIAQQLSLTDLRKGADSLEVRLWSSPALSYVKELFTLRAVDTAIMLSHTRLYLRPYDYEDKNWNPIKNPIVDSFLTKSCRLRKETCDSLNLNKIWGLHSQSEMKIPDSVGFLDCDSYEIEIADRGRYKFLMHHCPMGYYYKTKIDGILSFLAVFGMIDSLARNRNVYIPYRFD